jgi:Ca2+/H+ antiporter
MPTRKQRRREAKSKRHEYEFVYVDEEGNELEEPPEEIAAEPKARRNGTSPAAKKPAPRGGRTPRRAAQPPSWQRAARRAVLLGAVVFVLFSATAKGHNRYVHALVPAVIYTALFIPFTYMIDRYAYRRWQAKQEQGGGSTRAKKR